MSQVPIVMPQLGESIAEATIIRIHVSAGEPVEAEQEIMEVETNKAVMAITAPCTGTIAEIEADTGETYAVGTVLGHITSDSPLEDVFDTPLAPSTTQLLSTEPAAPAAGVPAPAGVSLTPVPGLSKSGSFVSPRVRARLDEAALHASELDVIAGTGHGGRVTVRDFESYLESFDGLPSRKCSSLRLGVADSMRRSWSRPLATVGTSLNLEPILAHRRQGGAGAAGVALYLVRALGVALGENPAFAGRILGDRLTLPVLIDIGVAVEVEDGVMVPVIRKVDETSLAQLAENYRALLSAAKTRRLPPEAQGPAIASVTNFGPLGITWGTPIPLPYETLIVGLGRGETRPFWDQAKQAFVPRREAELTVTFDHRVLDGGAAGRLVGRLLGLLGKPEQL
jgi:pyruvate/2-oxoglutarate dehydrogenase complex dihydrolipoamide acyltransferase (E2) component